MLISVRNRGFNLYNIQQINNKVKLFFSIDAGIIQFGRHLTKKKIQKKPLIWGLSIKNKRYDTMT